MNSVQGHLEILDRGFGFLRNIENNFKPTSDDTFVPAPLINQFRLGEGVFIQGSGVPGDGKNKNLKLAAIQGINQMPTEDYALIPALQDQTSISPTQRFSLTLGAKDHMGPALDLIVPVGKGQRGLIISPPKAGKTTILKHMTNAILANHPDTKVFVMLVDERPEEVTDFKRSISAGHVLHSSADQSVAQHMRMARLSINTAIRCAEAGDRKSTV